jgi:hypothetical protein
MMTLKNLVSGEKIRYALNCGVLTIKPQTKRVVQTQTGEFAAITEPGISLERLGGANEYGTTRVYDPAVKADRDIIEAVDQFMEDNPGVKGAYHIQIQKMGEFEPVRPFSAFDSDLEDSVLETMLLNGDYNLENSMKYELAKDEPRKNVLKVLEKVAKLRDSKGVDNANEAIEL